MKLISERQWQIEEDRKKKGARKKHKNTQRNRWREGVADRHWQRLGTPCCSILLRPATGRQADLIGVHRKISQRTCQGVKLDPVLSEVTKCNDWRLWDCSSRQAENKRMRNRDWGQESRERHRKERKGQDSGRQSWRGGWEAGVGVKLKRQTIKWWLSTRASRWECCANSLSVLPNRAQLSHVLCASVYQCMHAAVPSWVDAKTYSAVPTNPQAIPLTSAIDPVPDHFWNTHNTLLKGNSNHLH